MYESFHWGRLLSRGDEVVRVPRGQGGMDVVTVRGDSVITARCSLCRNQWLVERDLPLAAA
jgi:hypothetical protein